MPSAADFEKLGVFYLGRPYDLAAEEGAGRRAALRLEGPGHPRRLRRHDRQRQDRPLPRPCSKRRPSTASRRSSSTPRATSPTCCSRSPTCAPRTSGRGSTRTTPAQQGPRRRRLRRASRPSCGRRASPTGARTARASSACATPPTSRSTRRAATRASRSRSSSRSRRRRRRSRDDARAAARAHRRPPRRACWACSASTPIPIQSREHILLATILDAAWRAGQDLDLAGAHPADPDAAGRRASACSTSRRSIPPRIASRWRWRSTTCSPRRASRPGWKASRSTSARCSAHARGQAARRDLLDRAPGRRRAHVLRLAAAQPGARLDAHAVRHDQPARAALHGRDLRLLPAGGQSAVEAAAADAAQAGARLRPRRGAGHAEPGRPRLQGAGQRRHLVHRPAADRARQGARARRPRGRGAAARARASTAPRWSACSPGSRQPRVPDEQRARGRTRWCSRRAGRCRTCAGRSPATRSRR